MNNDIEISKREIVTICGSSRFEKEIIESHLKLSKQGYTVLSLLYFDKTKTDERNKQFDKLLKDELVESHFHKILLSDFIFVVNVDDYIGEHTRNEINFADKNNIFIKYYTIEKVYW